jgi:hypothetical protein
VKCNSHTLVASPLVGHKTSYVSPHFAHISLHTLLICLSTLCSYASTHFVLVSRSFESHFESHIFKNFEMRLMMEFCDVGSLHEVGEHEQYIPNTMIHEQYITNTMIHEKYITNIIYGSQLLISIWVLDLLPHPPFLTLICHTYLSHLSVTLICRTVLSGDSDKISCSKGLSQAL